MSGLLVPVPRFPSGVPGLDNVLQGGLPRNASILVEGPPGSGKTTIALQFLLQAVRDGESCLLATNAETPEQLRAIGLSHGWSLDGINITDLADASPAEEQGEYTLFPEAEVEVDETLRHLFEEVERLRPSLLVLDTISSLRILAPTPAFHRRQLKRIRDHMAARNCTTIMLDEASMTEKDLRSQTLADGIIELKQVDCNYGADRRRLRVRKLRGCRYLSGAHDFTIVSGGLVVYPRLVAQTYEPAKLGPDLQSGIPAIDALTGGGLPRGSSTLIIGPAGIGKSTISTLYAMEAAKRGEKSSILLFDESVETHMARGEGLGLDISGATDSGLVRLNHLDPAELSVGQIAELLVRQVEEEHIAVVVIDTLNGYLQSAMDEPTVLLHIRELITYLSRRNVAIFLTLTQHGILGSEMQAPIDLSFLTDNVVLLRYYEVGGAIHKALSVVKKRSGRHERTIRELVLDACGVTVSEPLEGFSGVLTGTPVYSSMPSRDG
ncbi:ATPase domain-containing protein [Methylocystis heyeri]|uniref:non-specific serine/threonine protein kinase n=1 Tax=Methylocystis heyeri TaxID=391905 RepID=A0A6B8KCR0_9HYPH|nr:ATPase domain-containing protein [Methylocystis heyeri]QGM45467.1 AAA family ATPase [Methylocystis heyeri]